MSHATGLRVPRHGPLLTRDRTGSRTAAWPNDTPSLDSGLPPSGEGLQRSGEVHGELAGWGGALSPCARRTRPAASPGRGTCGRSCSSPPWASRRTCNGGERICVHLAGFIGDHLRSAFMFETGVPALSDGVLAGNEPTRKTMLFPYQSSGVPSGIQWCPAQLCKYE